MTGAIVALVVLAAATAFGLVRKQRDGRLRPVAGAPTRAGAGAGAGGGGGVAAGPGARTGAGAEDSPSGATFTVEHGVAAMNRRSQSGGDGGGARAGQVLQAADLGGVPLGEKATLVQFSSAFCAPCRATRRILGEVTHMVEGVVHVEIDAEQHLDLVRRLNVLRTPTVFILDQAGQIVRRASGQPRKADVIAALGKAVS